MQNFFSTPKTRAFLYVWFGQFLSVIGSGMTSFVLAIWTYQLNASTAQFATVVFAAAFPSIVMAPFAGTLVDRWDSRKVLAWSVAGQAAATALLAGQFAFGDGLVYWHIYPAIVVVAVCGAFQGPALTTVGTALLPEHLYSRATGLWQLNQAAVMIVSPIIAAAIMHFVNISGIVAFDTASYVFAMASLLCLRKPIRVQVKEAGDPATHGAVMRFLHDMSAGWLFIRRHRSLTHLLVFSLFVNLVYDIVQILALPLTVKEGAPGDLAWLMALSATGMVVGSVVMAVWKGPRSQVAGVVASAVGVGAALFVAGLQRSTLPLIVCFFFFSLAIPLGQTMSGALWMRKTEPDLLGRVSATTTMLTQLCFPLACVIAPLLADHVFQPLLISGHWPWIASVFGTGAQRGVGVLLSLMGLLTLACAGVAWLDRPIRQVEILMRNVSRPDGDANEDAGVPEALCETLPQAVATTE